MGDLCADIRAAAALLPTGAVEEILRYLDEGNPDAAAELLETSGHDHMAAMNARNGEHLFELASRVMTDGESAGHSAGATPPHDDADTIGPPASMAASEAFEFLSRVYAVHEASDAPLTDVLEAFGRDAHDRFEQAVSVARAYVHPPEASGAH